MGPLLTAQRFDSRRLDSRLTKPLTEDLRAEEDMMEDMMEEAVVGPNVKRPSLKGPADQRCLMNDLPPGRMRSFSASISQVLGFSL